MKKYFLGSLFLLSSLAFGQGIGAKGALEDGNLSTPGMLTYALQDEYLAKNEYLATLEKFGNVRPFSNIVKSEEQHIAMLLPLFLKYGVKTVNEEEMKEKVKVASSLQEAAQICIDAEVDNIAMYEKFLAQKNLPEDLKIAFLNLKQASEKHLSAFKRQL
ncbi:MAG: DUF2202 domain-containing protein [Fusobacteriaceae bacterium]